MNVTCPFCKVKHKIDREHLNNGVVVECNQCFKCFRAKRKHFLCFTMLIVKPK